MKTKYNLGRGMEWAFQSVKLGSLALCTGLFLGTARYQYRMQETIRAEPQVAPYFENVTTLANIDYNFDFPYINEKRTLRNLDIADSSLEAIRPYFIDPALIIARETAEARISAIKEKAGTTYSLAFLSTMGFIFLGVLYPAFRRKT